MFGALVVLFVVPWLDTAKVRSLRVRPIARLLFWLLLIDVLVLSLCGARSPEGVWVLLARGGTIPDFAIDTLRGGWVEYARSPTSRTREVCFGPPAQEDRCTPDVGCCATLV